MERFFYFYKNIQYENSHYQRTKPEPIRKT